MSIAHSPRNPSGTRPRALCLAAALMVCLSGLVLHAGSDRVVKVLPHFVDLQGRHALSPSLFERDAYQAMLRAKPEKRGGLQYEVRWKARKVPDRALSLRLELVSERHPRSRARVIEIALPAKGGGWARIPVDKAAMIETGEVIAWRVSLLDGGTVVASQQSFLW